MSKYLKPRSLTWWSSVVPLICGLILASAPLHNAEALVEAIALATGDVPPAVLINAGLAGIGLRGALA
jgi:hypothetical protein